MALPTLTLTDPHNLAADMSLAMSPLQTTDSNTSFEFDRSSGRPGTASSIGNNDDGMSCPSLYCRDELEGRCLCARLPSTCHDAQTSNARDALSTPIVLTMPAARPVTPASSRPSPARQHNKTLSNSNTTSSPASRGPSPGRDASLRQEVRSPIDPLSQVRTYISRLSHKSKDLLLTRSRDNSKSSSAPLVPSNYPMLCDRRARAAFSLPRTMQRASMPPCLCNHLPPGRNIMKMRARS
jgi:hypothetical protein